MAKTPARYGERWTREELILAFHLYCRIPFQQTNARNPEVQALATLLDRSPASIARKLGNFSAFDPSLREKNISGLAHGSQLDREIWDAFNNDWSGLVVEAESLRRDRPNDGMSVEESMATDVAPPTGPSERTTTRKERIHQGFFREAILTSYASTCCVTGITIPSCLIASHIIPWARDERRRADPTNGLCLSATFDRLFDRGLMTINQNLTIRFSSDIHDRFDVSANSAILQYENASIQLPTRFAPTVDTLAWHRSNVFVD